MLRIIFVKTNLLPSEAVKFLLVENVISKLQELDEYLLLPEIEITYAAKEKILRQISRTNQTIRKH
jgi:hypothetical protein